MKFQWRVILKDIQIQNQKIVDYKQEINPDKFDKIVSQEKNNLYILELPKGATKELALFCLDKKVNTTNLLSFYRTGDKNKTAYHFALEEIKEE